MIHFKANDLKIKLQIWDTCGQEIYSSLVQGFYRNTSLAILVYDVGKKESFENLVMWIKDLREHTEQDIPIFMVGIENDLERKVTSKEAEIFSASNRIKFFTECSIKSGRGVKEIFMEAAKVLYESYRKPNNLNKGNRLKLDDNYYYNNVGKHLNKYLSF